MDCFDFRNAALALLFLGIFRITIFNFILAVRHKVEFYVKLLFYGEIIEKVNYKVGK